MSVLSKLYSHIRHNEEMVYHWKVAVSFVANRNMDMFCHSDDAVRKQWNESGILFAAEEMLNTWYLKE